jgi:hypothetical protein
MVITLLVELLIIAQTTVNYVVAHTAAEHAVAL